MESPWISWIKIWDQKNRSPHVSWQHPPKLQPSDGHFVGAGHLPTARAQSG